jgi:hypothetical protein
MPRARCLVESYQERYCVIKFTFEMLYIAVSVSALTKSPGIHVAISDGCHGNDGPPE